LPPFENPEIQPFINQIFLNRFLYLKNLTFLKNDFLKIRFQINQGQPKNDASISLLKKRLQEQKERLSRIIGQRVKE